MKAVCIDFETANSYKGSICSVGIAIIEDGRIVDTKYWLVKPHMEHDYFDPFHTMIHGIDEKKIRYALEFKDIYPQLKPLFSNSVIVAYNADFDISAFCQVLDLYNIEYPEIYYICTYKIALKTWIGLKSFNLSSICKFLNYKFIHHNAQEDAVACGKVLLAALAEQNTLSIKELASILGINLGKLFKGTHILCSFNGSKYYKISQFKKKYKGGSDI